MERPNFNAMTWDEVVAWNAAHPRERILQEEQIEWHRAHPQQFEQHLSQMGPIDGAQVALDTAIPVISARNAIQGVKFGQSALKKAPLINLPFLAYESIQNTRGGWGNAIAKQDAAVNGDMATSIIEGLANPLTTIANAGSKTPGAVADVSSLIARGASDEEMQAAALRHRQQQELLASSEKARLARDAWQKTSAGMAQLPATNDLSTMPAPQPPAPIVGDLSNFRRYP